VAGEQFGLGVFQAMQFGRDPVAAPAGIRSSGTDRSTSSTP
jgi:hypothetical protein